MKKFIKKNIKIILGFVLGLIWSGGIVYAATILFDSDEVSYDNTTSGLSATNVQSALDELYVESTSYQLFESRVSSIENKLYPVGSYLETSDSSYDPNVSIGGTWVLENYDIITGKSSKYVSSNADFEFDSIALESNTTYLLLGNNTSDYGGLIDMVASIKCTGSCTVLKEARGATRVANGGENHAWTIVRTGNGSATANIRSYGYQTGNTQTGIIAAIPLDYNSNYRWHRTA